MPDMNALYLWVLSSFAWATKVPLSAERVVSAIETAVRDAGKDMIAMRCLPKDLDTLNATLGRLGWRVVVLPTVLVTLRYACDSAAFREVLLRAPVTNKHCKYSPAGYDWDARLTIVCPGSVAVWSLSQTLNRGIRYMRMLHARGQGGREGGRGRDWREATRLAPAVLYNHI